jgi:hypothetical protein
MERSRPEQPWNPVENLPPREQAVERVVGLGVTPEVEGRIKQELRDKTFDHQTRRIGEIEKSAEEVEVIENVLAGLPDFISRYGGRPLPLTQEHFHSILTKDLPDFMRSYVDDFYGEYKDRMQDVRIYSEEKGADIPKTVLFGIMAHEAMHFNSFQSVQFFGGHTELRRIGMSPVSFRGSVGDAIDEAVTEELAMRYQHERLANLSDSDYEREQKLTDDLMPSARLDRPQDEVAAITGSGEALGDKDTKVYYFTYREERWRLNALLDDLVKERPDQFPDREAAFDMFARAYFTGNLLPLGRALGEAYGDKHALRRLMEGEDLTARKLGSKTIRQEPRVPS